MKPTAYELQQRFIATFGSNVQVTDNSHQHIGHAGAQGGGHYSVQIISEQFNRLSTLQRHRLVYQTVTDWIPNQIHALSIQAKTPTEI